MSIKVVIIGDIAIGHNISPAGKKTSLGGAAYYSSVGASRIIPDQIGIVATVGNDFDARVIKSEKIDVRGIKYTDGETAQFTAVQYSNNTRKFSAERGVADELNFDSFPIPYLDAKYFHLSTSLPQNYLKWIDFIRDHNNEAHISTDAFELYTEQFPNETLQALNNSNLIFLNEVEFQSLSNHSNEQLKRPYILKKGQDGAEYISSNARIHIPTTQVSVVDTSGAGDVLAGSFLSYISLGISNELALEKSVQLASVAITKFGVEHLQYIHTID